MLVFRIEAENGIGPYQSVSHPSAVNSLTLSMRKSHSDSTHPLPYEDGLSGMQENEYCGFESTEQMSEWFGGWESMLEKAGFSVVVYDVPDSVVRKGHSQVLFLRVFAEVVNRYLPTEILSKSYRR